MNKNANHIISLGLLGLSVSGCAVSNRLLAPKTPLHGQTATQVSLDKQECTVQAQAAYQQVINAQAHRETALLNIKTKTGIDLVEIDVGGDEIAAENKTYKKCMIERGYK